MEQEYLSLFLGKSLVDEQTVVFDVVPKAENGSKQMYIAFRISDTQGLVPASNMSGRPIVLELQKDGTHSAGTSEAASSAKGRIYYRQPATMTARLLDGQKEIMQGRMPVYQLGQTLSFPIDIAVK